MIKKLVPTYLSKSAYEIPPSFYRAIGKKVLLFDLDNTLDSVNTPNPSLRTKTLISSLKENGFRVYIASNNTKKRVSKYANILQIEAISGLFKPFSFKLKKWLKKKGYNKSDVILIGDQVFTDVLAANGAKIDVILTEPISSIDSIFTFFNRKAEKSVRKRILHKKLARYWEEVTL